MKTYANISILLSSLFLSSTLFGQWSDISPTTPNIDDIIYDIYFSSENNGIAVGTNPGTYEGLLYTTDDGGTTWKRNSYQNTAWRTIHFSDAQNGVITGRYSDLGGAMTTQLLITDDGGKTWNKTEGKDNGITGVSFIDAKIGYSIGGGPNMGENSVQKTTDGGKTWTSLWSYYGWFINSIYFLDENVGFIAGSDFTSGYRSILAKTTDGGKSFAEVNYTNEKNASGLTFTSSGVGYVLDRTGSSTRKLSKTVDKGVTWSKVADLDKDLHLLHFLDDNKAYAAGGFGKVFKSTDAGLNWTATPVTNYTKTIRNIKFYGKYMYALGQNPFIARIEHGGTELEYISTGINDIMVSNENLDIKLFPNPANKNGVVQIEGLGNSEAVFSLIDPTGKVIIYNTVKENQIHLNEASLQTGIYFYQVRSDRGLNTGRLVID